MEREQFLAGMALKYRVGSHLYGTNTPASDEDYSGVFVAPMEYYLGLKSVEEVDFSVKSKNATGKNNSDAVDFKLYELRKFFKLAMENNPNVLEQVFVTEDNLLFANELGRELLANRHMFLHKGLRQKYLGYAFSQRHKMILRTDKFYELKNGLEFLSSLNGEMFMAELKNNQFAPAFMKFDNRHALVGDLHIELTRKVRWAVRVIEDRLGKVGNRQELYLSKGYDTKFASHLVRLMLEGLELLDTGDLKFPLKDRQMLLDIKEGKWLMRDVLAYAEQLEKDFDRATERSQLPSAVRFDEINLFLQKLLMKTLGLTN